MISTNRFLLRGRSYDLTNAHWGEEAVSLRADLPDVVLVRKVRWLLAFNTYGFILGLYA